MFELHGLGILPMQELRIKWDKRENGMETGLYYYRNDSNPKP